MYTNSRVYLNLLVYVYNNSINNIYNVDGINVTR